MDSNFYGTFSANKLFWFDHCGSKRSGTGHSSGKARSLCSVSGPGWTIEEMPMAMAGLSMEALFVEGPVVSADFHTGWQRAEDLER
jgi:hypothetical protein